MSNIHGKDAVIYLSPGTGAAVRVSEQNSYSIEMDFDLADVSQLGDSWGKAVKGLMKWSGKCDGNFDPGAQTLWSASTASGVSNFYLYPRSSVMGSYYYGTCWVKLGTVLAGGMSDKAKTSVTLTGDGELAKV